MQRRMFLRGAIAAAAISFVPSIALSEQQAEDALVGMRQIAFFRSLRAANWYMSRYLRSFDFPIIVRTAYPDGQSDQISYLLFKNRKQAVAHIKRAFLNAKFDDIEISIWNIPSSINL